VSQALGRIRQAARQRKKERFTALYHHINIELLRDAFFALKREAAPGVDGLTWQGYAANLENSLKDLHARVQRGAYRALPSRRQYIPKPDCRQRPLAVAALEDKIVQRATATLLNAIYEEDFLGFSYGFRPGRGTHDALDALVVGIESRKVNWILDADIRAFFDTISQEWLTRFLEHRIGDRRIIRLIQKWLKAGILANIYLFYVLDLFAERWRRREATGDVIIVRYADDFIVGFEHEADARRFLDLLRERMGKFALALHPEKTRLIEFGRHAAANRRQQGLGKPENLQLPGLHLHLRNIPPGPLPDQTEVPARPHAGETPGGQAGAAPADASADPRAREMAQAGRRRLLQISRRADQQPCPGAIPGRSGDPMATAAQQTQPEGPPDLDLDCHAGGLLASQTAHPPSLAQPALRRHAPEVGAVCGKAARMDLCGGRGVISVPTATVSETRERRCPIDGSVPDFATVNPG
jgi:retron-type reverse transcriptase